MARGVVVIYFSWFGKPLQRHHQVVLDAGSKAIANIKGYDFGGMLRDGKRPCRPCLFRA
jgi:hypothetical protein